MLLASAGVAFAGISPASASTATGSTAQTAAAHTVRHPAAQVDGAASDAARHAKKKKHKKAQPVVWKQHTLYYYESIPSKWDWSLTTAVSKWNASGAKIRFVKVANRKAAKLVISYGNVGASAGEATVGPTLHPWVRLSNHYRNVNGNDGDNRVEVMAVFAHELGHVLGFEHTKTRCSLMSPVLDIVGCGMVNQNNPGYYRCRTISTPLEARLVRNYGGRARVPSSVWCLIDPMPPTLQGVTFSGGDSPDSPITVGWSRPSAAPYGSNVQIRSWSSDSCDTMPGWATLTQVPATAASWQAEGDQTQNQCFSVELVNQYGVGRQPVAGKIVARPVADETAPAGG
jgi:hypothetical protein